MVVQFVLMVAVALLGVLFHGRWTSPLLRVAGAALFVVGAVFGVAGGVVLGRNLTPFLQPPPGAELRQRGIYAHVRHLLYTGVMLTSAGWGLLCQSPEAFVVALALIPLLAGKARREEQCLRGQFPEYADYQRSVPQFWPRWHR